MKQRGEMTCHLELIGQSLGSVYSSEAKSVHDSGQENRDDFPAVHQMIIFQQIPGNLSRNPPYPMGRSPSRPNPGRAKGLHGIHCHRDQIPQEAAEHVQQAELATSKPRRAKGALSIWRSEVFLDMKRFYV